MNTVSIQPTSNCQFVYTVYDKNDRVLVITTFRHIAELYLRKGRSDIPTN